MQTRIEDAERIYSAAKQLLAEQRKYARIQERALALADATPRQRQKQNTDLNWQAFHIVKLEASLHAACVDAGIADLRELGHYEPYEVRLTGFHTYEHVPAKPRALAEGC